MICGEEEKSIREGGKGREKDGMKIMTEKIFQYTRMEEREYTTFAQQERERKKGGRGKERKREKERKEFFIFFMKHGII